MEKRKVRGFPKDFLWAAATAAFQVEGAYNEDGKSLSVIDTRFVKEQFADSKITSDFYHHYKEDIKLMAELGMKAYRFSIAWTRILPDGRGKVNEKGIEFYDNVINELLKYNIEPIVTIYHFDLPQILQDEYGGWADRKIIDDFEKFSEVLFRHFGDRVKYWLTINEQSVMMAYGERLAVYPKGMGKDMKYVVNHHFNLAHAKAVLLCHKIIPDAKIGPALGYSPYYAVDNKPMNVVAAMNAHELNNQFFLDIYCKGIYTKSIFNYLEEDGYKFDIREKDMDLLKEAAGRCDFIALNYYQSNSVEYCDNNEKKEDFGFNESGKKGEMTYPAFPGLYRQVPNKNTERTEWDWEIDPTGLRYILRDIYYRYNIPLMVTENGFGNYDILEDNDVINDSYRIDYLSKHIEQMKLAVEDGVEVIAYCPWTFIDVLSSSNGFSKRYGFVYVNRGEHDLKDMRRIRKKSFFWYKNVIGTNGEQL